MTLDERTPWPIASAMSLTTAAVITLQISLTRLFSATLDYHFAFFALAMVMLGLAGSSVSALRYRDAHGPAANLARASRTAGFGGIVTLVSVLAYVHLGRLAAASGHEIAPLFIGLVGFFVALWCAGYLVASLLDAWQADTSRLYRFDLGGAAVGCLLAVGGLSLLTPTQVLVASGLAFSVSGALLAATHGTARDRKLTLGSAAVAALGLVIGVSVPALLGLTFAKGALRDDVLWDGWNPMAHVSVTAQASGTRDALALMRARGPVDDREAERLARLWESGWGTSKNRVAPVPALRWIDLDAAAATQVVAHGDGMGQNLDFLESDVTSVAYLLRRGALSRVFVLGGGGGRDILTALHFGAREVDVAEINPLVVHAVDDVLGDFSGRVYELPQVKLHLGEGRNQLSRTDGSYDMFQMSMVDTWASSMAGALVLSENGLYTREAFDLYVSRLSDDGLLSVSRWYAADGWAETARLVRLEGQALRDNGVAHPEDHVAVVINQGYLGVAVATVIARKTPFPATEIATLRAAATDLGYEIAWPTDAPAGPMDVPGLLRGDATAIAADRSYDLSIPTDDRPFYFNDHTMVDSWIDAFQRGEVGRGSRASGMLAVAFLVLTLAGLITVVLPLRDWGREGAGRAPPASAIVYFAGIGGGFMLVELALVQRYILFLGHPTYALSVVLFTLLLASGVGSSLTGRVSDATVWSAARAACAAAIVGVVLTAVGVPPLLVALHPWPLGARIAVACALVAPIAVCLGTIYPLGVRMLRQSRLGAIVPGMWGVNGLAGVLASVAGMAVAMGLGYTAVLALAAALYAATWLAMTGLQRVATSAR